MLFNNLYTVFSICKMRTSLTICTPPVWVFKGVHGSIWRRLLLKSYVTEHTAFPSPEPVLSCSLKGNCIHWFINPWRLPLLSFRLALPRNTHIYPAFCNFPQGGTWQGYNVPPWQSTTLIHSKYYLDLQLFWRPAMSGLNQWAQSTCGILYLEGIHRDHGIT